MNFLTKVTDIWNRSMEWISEKWNLLGEKVTPVCKVVKQVCTEVAQVIKTGVGYVYKMRRRFFDLIIDFPFVFCQNSKDFVKTAKENCQIVCQNWMH